MIWTEFFLTETDSKPVIQNDQHPDSIPVLVVQIPAAVAIAAMSYSVIINKTCSVKTSN